MEQDVRASIRDEDRDSLHTLPLAFHPLENVGLTRSRMIKNGRLESVIELFHDAKTGSGQLAIDGLLDEFGWSRADPPEDFRLLRRLSMLPSFDVYSLRILLRQEGIPVNDEADLKLSAAKARELAAHMNVFTRPLIVHIYGRQDVPVKRIEDMLEMFSHPDVKTAKRRLAEMAGKLKIEPAALPAFLEDYGDIFLSLSFYKDCMERMQRPLRAFTKALGEVRASRHAQGHTHLIGICDEVRAILAEFVTNLNARFATFDAGTRDMWRNISADSFRAVERLITGHHVELGATLCALSVKMRAWEERFPTEDTGGVIQRAEFILSDMQQGLSGVRHLIANLRAGRASG